MVHNEKFGGKSTVGRHHGHEAREGRLAVSSVLCTRFHSGEFLFSQDLNLRSLVLKLSQCGKKRSYFPSSPLNLFIEAGLHHQNDIYLFITEGNATAILTRNTWAGQTSLFIPLKVTSVELWVNPHPADSRKTGIHLEENAECQLRTLPANILILVWIENFVILP